MTPGERRFAQRLQQKLEDDYLLWANVPVGKHGFYPDFIVLHPRRGLAVLEVKDWRIETIHAIDKMRVTLLTQRGLVNEVNPLEQARVYALAIVERLQRDPALCAQAPHSHAGKLIFPWTFGVVLTNITRNQFESANLGDISPSGRVICKDEMTEAMDAEAFQQHLWQMFPVAFNCALTLPQVDRIRYHLFPEIRIPKPQTELFPEEAHELPDIVRIMDIQQEQLARSLGEGHRVIHGVAGSGKTMILGYRCLQLAKVLSKPILVLCYNRALAARLGAFVAEKDIGAKVAVANFHSWCRDQLKLFHVDTPPDGQGFHDACVQAVIDGVGRGQIPAAQYGAVLVDEGHDFNPEWLKLIAQMVSVDTNYLLLLYDDAQSIYAPTKRKISFRQLGIQAQGRTTILRLNYRNTAEVLAVAYAFAESVLSPEEADDDGIPLIRPESAERHGPKPELVRLPRFEQEVNYIGARFKALQAEGRKWGEMAVVYRNNFMGEQVVAHFEREGIPTQWWASSKERSMSALSANTVKVITMHSAKGLEFSMVAIPGLGYLPHAKEDETAETRLLYVGMTRAMDQLLLTHHKESAFVARLAKGPVTAMTG